MGIIATLIIGALAGWLGSLIFKGSGLGLVANIIVGIIGSVVGSWVLGKAGMSFGGAGWELSLRALSELLLFLPSSISCSEKSKDCCFL